ncbi:hypothetical protein [Sphingomonas sp. ID0503]|uniref:hypothetical protein n=1 Tax=Sphingomonas sp. ID0503 TaxID=3399691 RepID=UPI003AFA4D9D
MSQTANGATLSVSAALPAAHTEAGFTALTFTEVGEIESIGTIGATTNKVEFQPLKGPKQKMKGSSDFGSLSPSMAYVKADAGQTILEANATANVNLAFKVTYQNGDIRYFAGQVFGWPENIGNADSVVMINPTIEINTTIIKKNAA